MPEQLNPVTITLQKGQGKITVAQFPSWSAATGTHETLLGSLTVDATGINPVNEEQHFIIGAAPFPLEGRDIAIDARKGKGRQTIGNGLLVVEGPPIRPLKEGWRRQREFQSTRRGQRPHVTWVQPN